MSCSRNNRTVLYNLYPDLCAIKGLQNSFPTSGEFCSPADNLQQNSWPGLSGYKLFDTLMLFLKDFFSVYFKLEARKGPKWLARLRLIIINCYTMVVILAIRPFHIAFSTQEN